MTLRTIGEEIGISSHKVHTLLSRRMKALAELNKGKAEHQRQIDLARLDMALQKVFDILNRPESSDADGTIMISRDEIALKAIKTMCGVLDRRARLLGLNQDTAAPASNDYDNMDRAQLIQVIQTNIQVISGEIGVKVAEFVDSPE
ncbi:hypothetical protein ACFL4G_08015 [Thermodesulfobacteriota bacterium]